MATDQIAKRLVAEARRHCQKAESCSPPLGVPFVTNDKVLGWSLVLDVYEHGGTEHWRCSAKLHPFGRSSTEGDWAALGRLLAEVTKATGYPTTQPMPEPLTPIETTHPNATLHWMWHGDGTPVDPHVERMLASILAVLTPKDPPAPAGPTAGRNDLCPCGSGRKYKKCHGGN